jgi:hypothetical protein
MGALGVAFLGASLAAVAAGDPSGSPGERLVRWVLGSGGVQVRDAANTPPGLVATVGQPIVGDRETIGTDGARFGFWPRGGTLVDVDEADATVPARTLLHQNRPNPFNPQTTFRFDLATTGRVSIRIFDVSGRRVATVIDETRPAGRHSVVFAPDDLPSGVYYAELRHADTRIVKSLTLLK